MAVNSFWPLIFLWLCPYGAPRIVSMLNRSRKQIQSLCRSLSRLIAKHDLFSFPQSYRLSVSCFLKSTLLCEGYGLPGGRYVQGR